MQIESIRTLNGANVYSHNPVLVARLKLEDAHQIDENTIEKLTKILSTLNKRQCGNGFADTFLHISLELMNLAEIGTNSGAVRRENDIYNIAVEFKAEEATKHLLQKAVELIKAAAQNEPFEVDKTIAEAKRIAADTELGPSARAIVEAAELRGIPWSRESSLIRLGYGKNLHLIQSAMCDRTSVIGVDLAGDKDATKQRLDKFSIPVPHGEIVRTEDETISALESIGAPVVIKPLDGRQGKGVSLNIHAPEEATQAFRIAQEFSPEVLVEESFEGRNYRVLVVNYKMVAASERVPCQVIGDGVHTLAELIELENKNPLRGEGHEKPLTKIKVDPILLNTMQKDGWTLESVPQAGQTVSLCAGMNLSTGGTAKDVTDAVHPEIARMCERAARIASLDICGVDLVLKDISEPLPKEKGGIIELNAAPGLRMHLYPNEGKPRDVGGAIVEMLYHHGARARIPIIAITGTNGKTTVTRMISQVLTDKGLTVGMTTTDGIYIEGEQIAKGDTTGPASAKTVLGDRAVEVAVLETARGGTVRRGLGYDWADIGVVTNVSGDHLGQDGIETVADLVNIKALVPERVRAGGTLVLNADDENVLKMLEREKVRRNEKRIVYFARLEENPVVRRHLAEGGTAYFTAKEWIVEACGDKLHPVVEVATIPATMNGAADFQIANAMATVAACRAYGVLRERVAWSLQHFRNDAKNPGRTNLYQVGAGHVLIDYGHNPEAFRAVCQMTAHWKNKEVIGIIGVPGDRNDAVIRESGKAAAKGFNRIIIKEDRDPRGRLRGEVASLLCQAVTDENPESECSVVFDEIEAFENELKDLAENKVVVLFYDKLEPVLEVLNKYRPVPVMAIEERAAQLNAAYA